jgi:histidyl-tRNA synthetase
MKNIIPSVKGTRDFYPNEMGFRNWLYGKVRQVSESFGYQEFEGPFLESIDLYAAKSGEELVKEQSFVFPDRGGDLLTLRPELTPTLVRMVAQKQRQLTFPLRWWSFGPFWRYERPQKGRTREFFQWNIDLIGVASPEADAEMVAIMARLFESVGLTPDEVTIAVNNRRLMDGEIGQLDIRKDARKSVNRLIDRKEKLSIEKWNAYALELGLSTDQIDDLNKLLSNLTLWEKSDELVRFFTAIDILGVSNYVQFDPKIIRGLDYYTGTVYEGLAVTPDIRRSISGGGRYDNLLADVGGDPLPGTGFAMGDMVISLLLEKYGHKPESFDQSTAPVIVTIFNEELLLDAYELADEFRNAGINVATYPVEEKLGKQFKYADRIGTKIAVVLGPDEISSGKVVLKDLRNRVQESVPRDTAAEKIRQMLAPGISP